MTVFNLIFGVILPFIGYRTLDVDKEGTPLNTNPRNNYISEALTLEWLGFGVVIYVKLPVRDKIKT